MTVNTLRALWKHKALFCLQKCTVFIYRLYIMMYISSVPICIRKTRVLLVFSDFGCCRNRFINVGTRLDYVVLQRKLRQSKFLP